MLHRANSAAFGVKPGELVELDPAIWGDQIAAGYFSPVDDEPDLAGYADADVASLEHVDATDGTATISPEA